MKKLGLSTTSAATTPRKATTATTNATDKANSPTKPKSQPRKKATGTTATGGNQEGDKSTPTPKKRGRPSTKKTSITTVTDAEDDDDVEVKCKPEEEEAEADQTPTKKARLDTPAISVATSEASTIKLPGTGGAMARKDSITHTAPEIKIEDGEAEGKEAHAEVDAEDAVKKEGEGEEGSELVTPSIELMGSSEQANAKGSAGGDAQAGHDGHTSAAEELRMLLDDREETVA